MRMPVDDATKATPPTPPAAAPAQRPLAIQVEDLKKAFRIPTQRVDSLKERAVHPFSSREFRELRALDGISFEIHQGEFIELGVGFNVELTARENVILNGVMMGLTQKQTRNRLDAILDFAELGDFVDLKLKNYSSGMLVRLAFSTMMEADADILLIDEVLAVGDAAFQQKCADAFHEMKATGKTIVLVTHEMQTVEEFCHRAMLIEGGKIRQIGDPMEIGREYIRLNFQPGAAPGPEAGGTPTPVAIEGARLVDAWIEDSAGERATGVEHGEKVRVGAEVELTTDTLGASVSLIVANPDGVAMFQCEAPIEGADGSARLRAGDRAKVAAEFENPMAPGRYYVHCGVQQDQGRGDVDLFVKDAVDFLVFGGERSGGVLALEHEIEARAEPGSGS
jgi:ABC-type polysaccharide/polyol phosphate transport system ATPase subunit